MRTCFEPKHSYLVVYFLLDAGNVLEPEPCLVFDRATCLCQMLCNHLATPHFFEFSTQRAAERSDELRYTTVVVETLNSGSFLASRSADLCSSRTVYSRLFQFA